jgi:lysylphosphatidylglycerol synthetase-like protein (DUF2156 family)
MTEMNATTSMMNYNGMASLDGSLLYYAIIIALVVGILFAAFYLIRYFRWFLYGLALVIPTLIAWWISKGAVDNAVQTGDTSQIFWIIGLVIAVPCSIVLGYFLSKLKIVKDWESQILVNGEGIEVKRKKK